MPVSTRRCPWLRLRSARPRSPATRTSSSAAVSLASIRHAVRDVIEGRACALVTNPIAKSVLYRAGFTDPGHTEYLARLAHEMMGVTADARDDAVVRGACGRSGHHSCAAARGSGLLNTELIVETGRIVARDLAQRFGIRKPRLAVTGLNPHAGEDGMIGDEELRIIRPPSSGSALGNSGRAARSGRHAVSCRGAQDL